MLLWLCPAAQAMSDVMVERVAGLQGEGQGVVLDGWPRSPADLQG